MKKILCISGSLRSASSATAVLKALTERLGDTASFDFAPIGDIPHYNADLTPNPPAADAFIQVVGQADGLIIATPEYNFSIPGVLKNAIDWASRPAYASVFKDKPVLILSVSGGALGGVRAQSHLKYVLNGILARVFNWQEVVIPQAPQKMVDGKFADAPILDFTEAAARAFIAELERS